MDFIRFMIHNIFDIPGHDVVGFQGLLDTVQQLGVFQVIEVGDAEDLFGLGNPGFRQLDRAALDIHFIVVPGLEFLDKTVCLQIEVGCLLHPAGNDQRGSGLIDQDRVHFIHQGKIQAPLHAVLRPGHHVVPQIVETEFRVGCICYIAKIRCPLLGRGHLPQVQADSQAEPAVNLAHPFRVTAGKIFVDRHDMDTLAGQRVQIDRHDRCQGLAFTGLHFSNIAALHDCCADHLHMVRVFPDHPPAGFPGRCERFRQDIIQRRSVSQLLFQPGCFGFQFIITHGRIAVCQCLCRSNLFFYFPQSSGIRFQQPVKDICHSTSIIKIARLLYRQIVSSSRNAFLSAYAAV